MTLEPLSPHEMLIRQSIEILQNTINDLCKRRDLLAAQLPNAPRQKMPTHFKGKEIRKGGGKMTKEKAQRIKEQRKKDELAEEQRIRDAWEKKKKSSDDR